jgi:hypothetical protein
MIYAAPTQPIAPTVAGAYPPGLAGGALEVEVYSPDTGVSAYGPSSAGITEPRAGTYHAAGILAPAAEGAYSVRWAATIAGELVVAEEDLIVTPTGAAPAPAPSATIATLDDFKRYLRTQGATGTTPSLDDELLQSLLDGATSRVIEAAPDRTIDLLPAAGDPVALTFAMHGRQRVLQVPDLREVTSIALDDGTLLAAEDYDLIRRAREVCALWLKLTAPRWTKALTITGRWGPAGAKIGQPLAVRSDIRDAVLVWAARAYHARTGRYADTVQDPAGGVASYFRNVPADVARVLDSLAIPGA